MIYEPFIGLSSGKIEWFDPAITKGEPDFLKGELWRKFADFEREKLTQLGAPYPITSGEWQSWGFGLHGSCHSGLPSYTSKQLINYDGEDYRSDSESSRLLARARFLKAVCEKEGVEWLEKPIEFRKCDRCEKPFPCAHEFKGATICEDCFKWWCGKPPERDYYTKAELEERFKAFSAQINKLAERWSSNAKKRRS